MHYLSAYWPTIARVVSTGGSLASVVALLVSLQGNDPWNAAMKFALALSALAFLATVLIEVRTFAKVRVRARGDRAGIRRYMHTWIEHGGRVAIWTRDHSWVDEDGIRRLLRQKAEARELILCLPEMTPFAQELASLGADVVAYGRGLSVPSIRFTIAHFEQPGSAVAVGLPNSASHIIEEYSSTDHVVFHFAQDLVRLARARGQRP